MSAIAAAVVLLAATLWAPELSAQDSAGPRLTPVWTWQGDDIAGVALATSNRCVAVAVKDAVVVLGADGKELWRWNFHRENRFITATAVDVAPTCDFVAIVGDVGYRYSWIAHRDGRRATIATRGTPLGVAISHDAARVAFGTGADDVWMYGSDGSPRWHTAIMGACCVAALQFADDDREIFVTGGAAAVLSAAGEVKWVGETRFYMWAAPHGGTFITHWEPPHGPGVADFEVTDASGVKLWARFGGPAVATAAGDLILASVNDNQHPTDHEASAEQPATLTLLDRAGQVLTTWPGGGEPRSVSADGRRVIVCHMDRVEALDRQGTVLWTIPFEGYPSVRVVEELNTVLIASRERISLFLVK